MANFYPPLRSNIVEELRSSTRTRWNTSDIIRRSREILISPRIIIKQDCEILKNSYIYILIQVLVELCVYLKMLEQIWCDACCVTAVLYAMSVIR